jgi:hypothetical protein
VFGARVSKDTISRITEKVIGEMTEWQNRPLDRVCPVMFIDAIHVKVRDGQVTNRPVYVAVGSKTDDWSVSATTAQTCIAPDGLDGYCSLGPRKVQQLLSTLLAGGLNPGV